jgi:hypothetical protein
MTTAASAVTGTSGKHTTDASVPSLPLWSRNLMREADLLARTAIR